jgi:hypothetical protein
MSSYAENFKLIDFSKEILVPPKKRIEPKRSDLPVPMVISDVMDPVQSQASGVFYDSKSAIRAEYRRLGMIEVGNDKRPPRKRHRTNRAEIKQTVEKAVARFNRGERAR